MGDPKEMEGPSHQMVMGKETRRKALSGRVQSVGIPVHMSRPQSVSGLIVHMLFNRKWVSLWFPSVSKPENVGC